MALFSNARKSDHKKPISSLEPSVSRDRLSLVRQQADCCFAFKRCTGESLGWTPQNVILSTDQKHLRQGFGNKDEDIKAYCKASWR